jgi:hypothetical protein
LKTGIFRGNTPGIALAILSRGMTRHTPSRLFLILLTSFVSAGRLHAHTVTEPCAVTQEINRCLMMVRIAATRRTEAPQKTVARSAAAKGKRYDDYQVPAGTPLVVRLRTTLDSASGQVEDPVRATLLSPVTQDGVELIPKGSTLHGKVIEVQSASKQKPVGRVVFAFNIIEHLETHSLATIETRSMPFDATLEPKDKFRDVRVESGEQLTLTLATPLKVRLPRAQ